MIIIVTITEAKITQTITMKGYNRDSPQQYSTT